MAPQDPQNGYGADGYNSDGYNNQGQYDPTYDQGSEYYIERAEGNYETSEQAQQDAERIADSQEEGGTWINDIVDMFTRQGRVEEAYDQQMTAQAAQLAQGVDTRPPPMMQCSNYMSNEHSALKAMVTEGVDPGVVGEMGQLWFNAGGEMKGFQTRVASAINASTTDWQGEGGDAARTFMANVGNWVGSAGESAQLAGTQTNIQSDALAEAKRTMPDPVDFDAAAANQDLQSTSNPLDMMTKYANYMVQYNQQQEAHQQAAQVVGTYDSGLSSASTMPAFSKPPVMKNPNGGTDGTDSGSIGGSIPDGSSANPNGSFGSGGSGSGGSGGGGNPPVSIPPPSGSGGTGSGSGGSGSGSGGSGFPGSTSPSGGGSDFPGPGGLPFPGPTGPGQGGTGPGGGNSNFPGGAPPLPVGMGGTPGGDDMSRRGFGSGRGFGPGSGFGSGSGGAGGAGGGMGGGRGGMGGMGPGGMGAGAHAAENAAMRGGGVGGAGAGRGGGMMGGGMGAGRGKGDGDDDDEHQRPSFLVEGDPDAVFGTDQITAPPVIGE